MELVKGRNILIGILALATVIVFSLCWFAAAVSDADWVFGANYLSDLGVSDYTWAHKFFNGGCLVAGVLLALCGTAIIVFRKNRYEIFGVFAIVAGIAMSLIGVVTEDAGDPHYYIALVAFGFGFFCLILLAIRDWCEGLRILTLLTAIGTIAVIVSFFIFKTDDAFSPGVETVMIIVLLSLFLLQGMKFIYHGVADIERPGIPGRHRVGFGFAALVGSVSFLALWMFATAADPSWTFGEDPAYMLGKTQSFFALACIAGGSFAIVYGVGAGLMRIDSLRSFGSFFVVIAGVLVAAIGMTFLAEKEVPACAEQFAIAFGMIALAFITASDWTKKRVMPAAFYLIVLTCGVISLLIAYDAASSLCAVALFAILGVEGTRLLLSK
ncbi:MAG: DUF998 domain-containing protein [Methanomassiliicoccaceae archaeon]|jgi:hypothetical membrane protein|nr:DUF998 domain-containing protein [Methanomassiliicoccaceae archaeon]